MPIEKSFNEKLTDFLGVSNDIQEDMLPDQIGPVVRLAGLSGLELKLEERRLAKLERKRQSLRNRKPYTRKPGCVHPNKKKASRRRLMAARWAKNPWGCIIHGYGRYNIPKEEWDKKIGPLWDLYEPAKLVVKRMEGYGTREKPHTVYTLRVLYDGLEVYNGNSQQIFDLSS